VHAPQSVREHLCCGLDIRRSLCVCQHVCYDSDIPCSVVACHTCPRTQDVIVYVNLCAVMSTLAPSCVCLIHATCQRRHSLCDRMCCDVGTTAPQFINLLHTPQSVREHMCCDFDIRRSLSVCQHVRCVIQTSPALCLCVIPAKDVIYRNRLYVNLCAVMSTLASASVCLSYTTCQRRHSLCDRMCRDVGTTAPQFICFLHTPQSVREHMCCDLDIRRSVSLCVSTCAVIQTSPAL